MNRHRLITELSPTHRAYGYRAGWQPIPEWEGEFELEVVEEFIASKTPAIDSPEFWRMVAELRGNPAVKSVVVPDMTHLAVNYMDRRKAIDALLELGVSVFDACNIRNATSAEEEDPMVKAVTQMKWVFHEHVSSEFSPDAIEAVLKDFIAIVGPIGLEEAGSAAAFVSEILSPKKPG